MRSVSEESLRQWQEIRTLVRSRPTQSLNLAQAWVRDATTAEVADGAAYALSALSWAQFRCGHPDSALRSLQGILELAPDRLSVEARACCYATLATVCLQHLDTKLALRYARRALALAERGSLSRLVLDCMAVLGSIESNVLDGEPGKTSGRLLERLEAGSDKRLRMIALADVAYVKFGSGHYASGAKYAQEAYKLSNELDDRIIMASAMSAYALNCAGKGDLDTANEALDRSHALSLRLADGICDYGAYLDYAEVYFAAGLQERAMKSAQVAFYGGVESKQWNIAVLAMRFAKRAAATHRDAQLEIDQASRDLVLRNIANRLPRTVKEFPLH